MSFDLLYSFFMGFFSFISPCVLPLIPVYIFYITGLKVDQKVDNRSFYLFRIFMFISGFTLIYVALALLVSTFSFLLNRWSASFYLGSLLIKISFKEIINIFFGLIVIVFALHLTGIIKLMFLNIDTRINVKSEKDSFFGSFLMGMAFAAGWSPCTGPFLGTILGVVATGNSMVRGVVLLLFYSLGIALPLLLTALFFNYVKPIVDFLKRKSDLIKIISGVILLFFGIMMIFGLFNSVSSFIFKFAYFIEDTMPVSNYIISSIILIFSLIFFFFSLKVFCLKRMKIGLILFLFFVFFFVVGFLSMLNILPVAKLLINYLTYTG